MKYLNDHYKQLINNSQLILAKMKMVKEVQDFYKGFKDDPKELSQWGHNYFCNIDGGRLIYNSNKPHSHVCEICKHEYKDQVYDGVWWYFYRNEAVLTMMKASALYKATGDQVYLEIFKNLILFYANNYQKFPIHDKAGNIYENYEKMKWGCGRILPQGLNEAFITNRMIQALEIVKEDLDQEFLEHLYTNLFIEIYKLLKPQVNKLSNISCWKNVAIGMIGMFFDKKEMIDNAVNGAYGLNYQVKQGVTAEYFWFEGSIHYNFFTLESLSMYLLFSKIYDFPLDADIEDTIKKMMMAGYHYAFNNLYFPNPNDGWPNVNLKTYSYIYHVMTKCYGYDSEIGTILKVISQDKSQRTPVPLSKPYYVLEDLSFENLVLNTDFDNFENISLIQETANHPM
ncbi:MAG: alginate lyase family protein, partial [Bacilli bacterium]|nr:alginate lyase family protein [Bacilli bacterium]